MPLDRAEATRLLNAMLDKATYTAPSTGSGLMLRLTTANGDATSPGTEVANAGGSAYAPQNIKTSLPTAANGTAANNAASTFTNMPSVTSVGVEVWDTAATPRRQCYAALGASKATSTGDSLTFAASALTFTLT